MKNIKGCVLAAGFGTRLRPLTEKYPKPLIPFIGSSPLELALFKMKQAKINSIAINAHYLPEKIALFQQSNPFDQKLFLSVEQEILGTGGCYNPLRGWLGDSDLLVYNGDIISDIDFNALIETHNKSGAIATMAVLPEVIAGENGFACNSQGQVISFGNNAPPNTKIKNFACAQILSPKFLDLLPKEGNFCIMQKGYIPALAAGEKIFSFEHRGFWHDLRSPWFFKEAVNDFLQRISDPSFLGLLDIKRIHHQESIIVKPGERIDLPFKITGPALVDKTAELGVGCSVGPNSVIEAHAKIGSNCQIENSLVMQRSTVKPSSHLKNAIVGDGISITNVLKQ